MRPEQIKPFINHPERAVRNFAVEYFSQSFSKDADLLPLVLQSVTAAPTDPDNELRLTQAQRFTSTIAAVTELFGRIKADEDEEDDLAYEYEELLLNSDLELLTPFFAEQERLHPAIQEQLAIRRRLADFSTEHLWAEFLCYGKKGMDDNYGFGPDVEFCDDYDWWLVRELVKREDLPLAEVMACLNTAYDSTDYFMEVCLCELVGELKLAAGLPFLLQCLAKENESVNEEATEALVKLGTAEIVQTLETRYLDGTPEFRLYATEILMNIKLPESEQALLRLSRQETDPAIVTMIAAGLCNLLSEKAIPFVRELIHQGYEYDMVCLEEKLYSNCLIHGKDLPEMPKWRKIIAENFAEIDSWDGRDDHENVCDCDCDDCDCHCEEYDDNYDEEVAAEEWDDEEDTPQPHVEQRFVTRIGRNDPCPCGSGKKYKKCCLSKE